MFCSGRARREKTVPEVERGLGYYTGNVQRMGNACVRVSNICGFIAFRATHCSAAVRFSLYLAFQPISQWLD